MEAIDPHHANRLWRYDRDPATASTNITIAKELRGWYDESVGEILLPPIAVDEMKGVELFFSSLDESELLALYGLEHVTRYMPTPESAEWYDHIVDALPVATAATEQYPFVEEILRNHKAISRIARFERGFLRSVLREDDPEVTDFKLSKGALHTHYANTDSEITFELGDVVEADIALLTTHEVLVRRLARQPSTRHTVLPFEYSRVRRQLDQQQRTFSDIDAARRFMGEVAQKGMQVTHMNEPYQQGLLSILQNCSLFPDISKRFHVNDRDGFIAMQEKIAALWPMPGFHGTFAQCGIVFDSELLHYDGSEVRVDPKLESAMAVLPSQSDKLTLQSSLQVPLYVGPRATIAFRPTDLPGTIEDTTAIKGKLAMHPHTSPFRSHTYTRCPALAKNPGSGSLIAVMAALVYDHAKTIEPLCKESVRIIELDDETLFALTDTATFRSHIPQAERDSWIDEDGIDNIANDAWREPELRVTYLVETVKPVLLQLGRRALMSYWQ